MSIIDVYWRLSLDGAFEWATWQDKRIKVKVLSPQTLKRGVYNNVIADEGYLTLQTRFVEDYKIDDEVEFRGKRYVITDITRDTAEVVPQASMMMGGRLQDVTLQLFEVNGNTRNLHCATPIITIVDNVATITCDTMDAVVYYSLDGYVPSSLSPKYSQPFDIGTADKVYALALKDGRLPSRIGVWKK